MTRSEKIKLEDEKSVHLGQKTGSGKQKSSNKAFFLGIGLLFCLVLYLVFAYKESWLGLINRVDIFGHSNFTENIESALEEQEPVPEEDDQDTVGNDKDGVAVSREEQKLPRFAPDEKDLDILNDDEGLSPYDQQVKSTTSDNTKIVSGVNVSKKLNDYRIYLANTHALLYKFSKNQPYYENLEIVAQIQLPKEFEKVIEMFKKYNEMLVANDKNYEQIQLFGTNIFSKFLKIQKETDSYKEMKTLKVKIEDKIDLFSCYLFSLELQRQFLQ